ncbi:MAG: RNA methyltransferase [Bdellovibrionota bacterium]
MTSESAKLKKHELKYYGRNACLAVFKRRRADIQRVYVSESETKAFGLLLKWCAKEKLPYRVVPSAELEPITASKHHEGICVLAKRRPLLTEEDLTKKLAGGALNGPIVYLDGVENPHNIGSILRTCAHFGVKLLMSEGLSPLPAAACRIAEGAAEYVQLASIENVRQSFERLKRSGYRICATTVKNGEPLYRIDFKPNTVFVLGSEGSGISRPVAALADTLLTIPGSGEVESLNVSSACAVILSEHFRRTWKS